MSLLNIELSHCLKADFIKIKNTPILWISLLGGVLAAILIFAGHFATAYELEEAIEPWVLYLRRGYSVISYMAVVPYVVLLTGFFAYIEHQSLGWKHLYSLPILKRNIHASRLFFILLLTIIPLFLFWTFVVLGGFIIEAFKPEVYFGNKTLESMNLFKTLSHTFIAVLGVIGFQYWLSIRIKNVILPIGFGFMMFIVGLFSLGGIEKQLGLFYAYPMYLVHELDEFHGLQMNNLIYGLTKWEWFSIAFFVIFSIAGFLLERNRNIE